MRNSIKNYFRRWPKRIVILIILLIGYYFSLPTPLFDASTSTILTSRNGELLGAKIAFDGQWRFPVVDSVPYKFRKCIIAFEDQQFYNHFGFNPIRIIDAARTNFQAGKVIRGGSTITQQLIRLSRKGKERTYFEKMIELVLATRVEFGFSKEEILNLYASYAPFGGNVVGLDMASWRYYGISADQLSWSESATLAVLPNAPSLIYPGRNQDKLLNKRNQLLKVLLDQNTIDSITYKLSIQEKLPKKAYQLPQKAPHLLAKLSSTNEGDKIVTTIDHDLQVQVNRIVKTHYDVFKQNEVYNMAVLVLDVKTREVLSYVGNSPTDKTHQKDVDIIQSVRSTGSTLKPLLYALMMDKGELLPEQLVVDVPTTIAGYAPKNYDENYSGAVPADEALSRSLNIPAVRLLQKYGLKRFREELNSFNIKGIQYGADHYGLSLIVGGAEGSLWDLCKTYGGLAGTLNNYVDTSSEYYKNEFIEPILLKDEQVNFGIKTIEKPVLGAGSIWKTFEAMKKVNRPQGDEAWEFYDSSKEVAWKTGTSYGNRDAWAIGTSKDYVVGVWVGNADGEGRPGLTGINVAAPVLFDVFDILPNSPWFSVPYDDLVDINVCEISGFLASEQCPVKKIKVPVAGQETKPCSFHKRIHLDVNEKYRVNSSCQSVDSIKHKNWFVLPPLQAYYYKKKNATYRVLPPYRKDCTTEMQTYMEFIFPKTHSAVYLPKGFDGNINEVVFKIAHSVSDTKVFWYIDDQYIGTTTQFHEMPIKSTVGIHRITILDELGNQINKTIEIKQ